MEPSSINAIFNGAHSVEVVNNLRVIDSFGVTMSVSPRFTAPTHPSISSKLPNSVKLNLRSFRLAPHRPLSAPSPRATTTKQLTTSQSDTLSTESTSQLVLRLCKSFEATLQAQRVESQKCISDLVNHYENQIRNCSCARTTRRDQNNVRSRNGLNAALERFHQRDAELLHDLHVTDAKICEIIANWSRAPQADATMIQQTPMRETDTQTVSAETCVPTAS